MLTVRTPPTHLIFSGTVAGGKSTTILRYTENALSRIYAGKCLSRDLSDNEAGLSHRYPTIVLDSEQTNICSRQKFSWW